MQPFSSFVMLDNTFDNVADDLKYAHIKQELRKKLLQEISNN